MFSPRWQWKLLEVLPVLVFEIDLQRREQAHDAAISADRHEEIDQPLAVEMLPQRGKSFVRQVDVAAQLARRLQYGLGKRIERGGLAGRVVGDCLDIGLADAGGEPDLNVMRVFVD